MRSNLVLINFMRQEKIKVNQERRKEAIEKHLANYDDEELRTSMREYLETDQGFSLIGSEILMDLIIERMQAIGNGTAPDLAELEAAAESATGDEELVDEALASEVVEEELMAAEAVVEEQTAEDSVKEEAVAEEAAPEDATAALEIAAENEKQ